ncbi:MAG TPA: GNAT family N-acetyltransferase [Candidatus Polarisedimenticolia bacterium]|nr:GNAT family N-acetyltransferase [Candidatus Polarisedimenticolia bacterium]
MTGFRKARPDEAERLTALAVASKASWGYPAAWIAEWTPGLAVTPDYIEREVVWVVEAGTEVVGFYALVARGRDCLLDHFWVDPGRQGSGVGRAMFEHAVEHVRHLGADRLMIESDPNAAAFYLHMGASEIGHLPAPVAGDAARRLPVLEVRLASGPDERRS